ncbi:tRNA processing ribonuclease BN [Francisella tularensis subsp. novicida GA99-3548]|uniref:YhjD/YihY/BrkB family envelope integrity protein n=1 Tax=Francisella TaxID=262 RepID=UPI000158AE5A|nr:MULTISPECIES: YhjD/YihY/BrkB family envelope integrity protein [Francisella]AJI72422.1 YihY family inner membrane domain protein [Francisella tularensis subsp. novicida D9876]EDN37021.1 tRNA processing ribonuclease BN [Francisella tularensis subsp. novicida GA99-3548]MBK2111806.1 YihY family inner membrane protein [Francisella tularensis subsp. novicida FSC159]OIN83005.1 YihY family inner membrane domain protein [Francisella sp. TX07-6608]
MFDIRLYKKYLLILKNYWIWVFKEYLRKDCPTVAASITLTSLFAIVPAFFIIINILDAFNAFSSLSESLQNFLFENMLPETATTVQQYITKISHKMTSLPITSVIVLLVVIFLMIKRLEITLNKIFYANRQRPMLQSLLVYWALMTMGPLLMGFVFISSTYLISMAWFVKDIGMEQYLLSGLSLIFLTTGFFVVYKILPNTRINSKIALLAAFLVAIVFTLAKKIFALYMFYVPTYSVIYGSLSLIPIFILWVFVTWQITLLGAVMIRAMQYMKVTLNFKKEVKRDDLSISVNMLKELHIAQRELKNGMSINDLYQKTSVADYDKIKKILYALETANIIRITAQDICYLNCDVFDISLYKIYLAFNPTINFKTSSIRKINVIKSQLYKQLDIKLYECF